MASIAIPKDSKYVMNQVQQNFCQPQCSKRIASIDGLRGLAILLVLAFHTYARWSDYIPWVTTHKDFFLFKFGFLGVELFFLISGFVIYMTLEKCRSFNEFMFRRWLRLFPAMLLATILIYATSFFLIERPNGRISFWDILPGLLFVDDKLLNSVQGLVHTKSIEGVFWSLFVEVKFYLIFGALYFYNKNNALRNLIALFLICFVYVAAGMLFPFMTLKIVDQVFLQLLSLQYFGWFCVGALLYKAHLSNDRMMALSSALLMVPTVLIMYGKGLNIVFFCTMIYVIFYFALTSKAVSSFFKSRVFVFFGFVSYPLYLIHENAMVALTIKTHHSLSMLPAFMTPWPGVAAIVLVSYFLAKYLEPVTRTALRHAQYRLSDKKGLEQLKPEG